MMAFSRNRYEAKCKANCPVMGGGGGHSGWRIGSQPPSRRWREFGNTAVANRNQRYRCSGSLLLNGYPGGSRGGNWRRRCDRTLALGN